MVGIDSVTHPYYTISGAASDSLVTVLIISGAVTIMALVFGIVLGSIGDGPEHGFLRKKPAILPSFAFLISVILVIALYPIPMAQYLGTNDDNIHFTENNTTNFRIYDGMAYQDTIVIFASYYLEPGDSIVVQVEIKQESTVIATTSFNLNGTTLGTLTTNEIGISLQPGLYQVDLSYSQFEYGTPVPVEGWVTVILSQPLASGFFDEVLDWQTYTFFLYAGSFLFILIGLCVGREDKKRISQEKIDQEPPKDVLDYYRKGGY